jgi:hypothetical protein
MILTVVLLIAGSSQSPWERPVPWKPQSHTGMSPLEQSSYLIGTEARSMSAVIVMTSGTPGIYTEGHPKPETTFHGMSAYVCWTLDTCQI